jgi:hypothetical protein
MHSSLLLIAVSVLVITLPAYTIVPGLIASARPFCTYVTFYYDHPTELTSATSSFLSSNGFCTIAGSVALRVAPSPTPVPSLSQSIHNSLPTILYSMQLKYRLHNPQIPSNEHNNLLLLWRLESTAAFGWEGLISRN